MTKTTLTDNMEFLRVLNRLEMLAKNIHKRESILISIHRDREISQEARHEVEEALEHLTRATYFLNERRDAIGDHKKPDAV